MNGHINPQLLPIRLFFGSRIYGFIPLLAFIPWLGPLESCVNVSHLSNNFNVQEICDGISRHFQVNSFKHNAHCTTLQTVRNVRPLLIQILKFRAFASTIYICQKKSMQKINNNKGLLPKSDTDLKKRSGPIGDKTGGNGQGIVYVPYSYHIWGLWTNTLQTSVSPVLLLWTYLLL